MPENSGFIVAAYVITWVTILGYAVRLVFVSRRVKEQLAQASQAGAGSET